MHNVCEITWSSNYWKRCDVCCFQPLSSVLLCWIRAGVSFIFSGAEEKRARKIINNDRIQGEIRWTTATIDSSPASLPRKQQMTQKQEMKTQDTETPQLLGSRVGCLTALFQRYSAFLQYWRHVVKLCQRQKQSQRTNPSPQGNANPDHVCETVKWLWLKRASKH